MEGPRFINRFVAKNESKNPKNQRITTLVLPSVSVHLRNNTPKHITLKHITLKHTTLNTQLRVSECTHHTVRGGVEGHASHRASVDVDAHERRTGALRVVHPYDGAVVGGDGDAREALAGGGVGL